MAKLTNIERNFNRHMRRLLEELEANDVEPLFKSAVKSAMTELRPFILDRINNEQFVYNKVLQEKKFLVKKLKDAQCNGRLLLIIEQGYDWLRFDACKFIRDGTADDTDADWMRSDVCGLIESEVGR